jgi:hypothetical protein
MHRATAPPGFQITNIFLTFASVETSYDYCTVRNAIVTTWSASASALYSHTGVAGAVSVGPFVGNYGGTVQFDLFSDSSSTSLGCRWTFGVSACPAGRFCPSGSTAVVTWWVCRTV